ncbi:MAG: hypothetical protein JO266_11560 [Acidobacteria bacterium]|nr:hypothetical protein [Acidobacteriota bacterium]
MLRWQFHLRPKTLGQTTVVVLFILAATLSVGSQTSPKIKKQKLKPAETAEIEATAASAPPPPPPTPEQMPPRPPTVSYQNGQLSIVAPNSTLSDILQAVRSKTGASIDIPPGANERVVSRFGPGPARDVLAALLNGSHFNYVMIGSDANPTSVAQVILTPRTGGESPPAGQPGSQMPNPGAPQYSGQVMRPQPYPGAQVVYQPAPAGEEPPPADSEEDDAAGAQQDNGNGPDENAEQPNPADGQENGQPQVKTPEQLLQELQRQQQIQQQQQQQQPQQQGPAIQQPPPPPQ